MCSGTKLHAYRKLFIECLELGEPVVNNARSTYIGICMKVPALATHIHEYTQIYLYIYIYIGTHVFYDA